MRKDLDLLILMPLLASCFASVVFKLVDGFSLDPKFYVGCTLSILTLLLRLKFKKISNILLWSNLILGTLNLVSVSHIEIGFTFKVGELATPGFNPLMAILLLFWYLAHQSSSQSSSGNLIATKKSIVQRDEEMIQMYMKQYQHKTKEELENIATGGGKYVESAVIACQRLLDKRNENAL